MPVFYDVNNYRIAYGLYWGEIKKARKEKPEVNALAKTTKGKYKVRLATNAVTHFGFIDDLADIEFDVKKGRVVAAAVLFAGIAQPEESSLLVQKINDKQVSLIAFLKGEFYLDIVVSVSDYRARIQALKAETNAEFVMYGNYADIDANVTALAPAELLKSEVKAALLKKHTDGSAARSITITVILLAAALGGLEWHKQETKRKEQEAQLLNVVDPVKAYKDELQKLLPGIKLSVTDAQKIVWPLIAGQEIDVAGWHLQRITCFKAGQCETAWLRSSTGTNQTFKSTHTGLVKFGPEEGAALNVISFQSGDSLFNISNLPEKESFWLHLTSLSQNLRYAQLELTATPAALFGLPIGIGAGDIPKNVGISSGTFKLSGPIGLARDALALLPANLTIDELQVMAAADGKDQGAGFTVKGQYYVKN